MPVRPIIPYSNVVLIPFVANLGIMVLSKELHYKLVLLSQFLDVHGLTLKRYCNSTSDSSLVTPFMRLVKPLFTKTDFQPVTAIIQLEMSVLFERFNQGLTISTNHRVNCSKR